MLGCLQKALPVLETAEKLQWDALLEGNVFALAKASGAALLPAPSLGGLEQQAVTYASVLGAVQWG